MTIASRRRVGACIVLVAVLSSAACSGTSHGGLTYEQWSGATSMLLAGNVRVSGSDVTLEAPNSASRSSDIYTVFQAAHVVAWLGDSALRSKTTDALRSRIDGGDLRAVVRSSAIGVNFVLFEAIKADEGLKFLRTDELEQLDALMTEYLEAPDPAETASLSASETVVNRAIVAALEAAGPKTSLTDDLKSWELRHPVGCSDVGPSTPDGTLASLAVLGLIRTCPAEMTATRLRTMRDVVTHVAAGVDVNGNVCADLDNLWALESARGDDSAIRDVIQQAVRYASLFTLDESSDPQVCGAMFADVMAGSGTRIVVDPSLLSFLLFLVGNGSLPTELDLSPQSIVQIALARVALGLSLDDLTQTEVLRSTPGLQSVAGLESALVQPQFVVPHVDTSSEFAELAGARLVAVIARKRCSPDLVDVATRRLVDLDQASTLPTLLQPAADLIQALDTCDASTAEAVELRGRISAEAQERLGQATIEAASLPETWDATLAACALGDATGAQRPSIFETLRASGDVGEYGGVFDSAGIVSPLYTLALIELGDSRRDCDDVA